MKNLIKASVFSLVFLSFFAQSMQSKPEIIFAWYGNDDPKYMPTNEKTAAHVVNKLRSIVDKYGFIAIPADQHKFYGFDPIPNVKKTTAIHIRHLGKEIGNLRASEGVDFVYPTNTNKNLVQNAFQEIKAQLTTASIPVIGQTKSSQQANVKSTLNSKSTINDLENLFPDICLPDSINEEQRIEDNGIVLYFSKIGEYKDNGRIIFKGIPLNQRVCSIMSKNLPPLTGVKGPLNLRDENHLKTWSLAFLLEPGDYMVQWGKSAPNDFSKPLGIYAELCPEAITTAQTMINNISDPNKISLKIGEVNKYLRIASQHSSTYQNLGEVIGIIINQLRMRGVRCGSAGNPYYAITPVPAPNNPHFKIVQIVRSGNLTEFKQIVENKSLDINAQLAWSNVTPLIEAIKSKQSEIAKYLINKGAIITKSDEKAIVEEMVKQNDTALIQLALQKKLVEPKVVIELATKYNNYALVNLASQSAITNNKESK